MNRKLLTILVLPLVATACVSSSSSRNPLAKRAIVPDSMKSSYASFKFAPAIRAGDFLYLSGVVAVREAGETQDTPSIVRAFDEIELILAESGASWRDVVDVTSYLTDLDNQIGPLWAVKEKRVPAPYPAWTAIGVERLYGGEAAIIEIKVTVYLPDNAASN